MRAILYQPRRVTIASRPMRRSDHEFFDTLGSWAALQAWVPPCSLARIPSSWEYNDLRIVTQAAATCCPRFSVDEIVFSCGSLSFRRTRAGQSSRIRWEFIQSVKSLSMPTGRIPDNSIWGTSLPENWPGNRKRSRTNLWRPNNVDSARPRNPRPAEGEHPCGGTSPIRDGVCRCLPVGDARWGYNWKWINPLFPLLRMFPFPGHAARYQGIAKIYERFRTLHKLINTCCFKPNCMASGCFPPPIRCSDFGNCERLSQL